MIPARETERMMKLQDVILKAMAKKLTWIEAAEIAGMSVRNMQRMRERYQEFSYDGLLDRRRSKATVGCNISQPDFSSTANMIFRIPTPTFGGGLIDAITDTTIPNN
jgi:hypothetical protein